MPRTLDRTALWTLAVGVSASGLMALAGPPAPLRFLAVSAAVWALVTATFARLRAVEGDRRPPGLATQITLLRAGLICAVAGFVLDPPRQGAWAWVPAVLYTVAALCDLVDGYVARRRGEVSAVGGQLDVATDGFGLLAGSLAAIALGRLPVWYLALGTAYYLFHAELWLRARRGQPVHMDRLRPSRYTRQFAGCQMGLVATALFPVLGPPATTITAAVFMAPSLVLFVRDWLVVIGRIAPERGAQALGRLGERLARTLALPLRLVGAAGTVLLVVTSQLPPAVLVLAALVAVGVLTRVVAFAAAVAVAQLLQEHPSGPALASFAALVTLIVTGAGHAALWSPEDRLMLRRAGEGAAVVTGPSGTSRGPS